MKRQPPLSKRHEMARLEFAKKHATFGDQWQNVVFLTKKTSISTTQMVLDTTGMIFGVSPPFFLSVSLVVAPL